MPTQSHQTRRILKWSGAATCGGLVLYSLCTIPWIIKLETGIGMTPITIASWEAASVTVLVWVREPGMHWSNQLVVERRVRSTTQWVPTWDVAYGLPDAWDMYIVCIPLWIPFLAIAIPTIILWRRDRRHPPGHCQGCGYDLTGNESGKCPECGLKLSDH